MHEIHLTLPTKTLIVPVGLPGSGKTSLLKWTGLPGFRHGADDVRERMFGDVSIQGLPSLVHAAARSMLEVRLYSGLPAAYDATNLTVRDRNSLFALAEKYGYYTVALISQVSVEVAKKRNRERVSPVPEFVIDRMVKKLEVPKSSEGFDKLVYFDHSTTELEVEWVD